MIFKAYKIADEIRFVPENNYGYPDYEIIEEREFSDDERRWPLFKSGKIKVDEMRRNKDLSDERKFRLQEDLKSAIDSKLAETLKKYPKHIIESFAAKDEEARQLLSGAISYTDTKIIFSECQKICGTLEPTEHDCIDLAKSIQANSDNYKKLAGAASGLFKNYYAEIVNCDDIFSYELPEIKLI